MKNIIQLLVFLFIVSHIGCGSTKSGTTTTENPAANTASSATEIHDSNAVSTTGFFDGKFHQKRGYKINEYYIRLGDVSKEELERFTRKRVVVTGTLLNPDNNEKRGFQSTNDSVKFIYNPVITLQ